MAKIQCKMCGGLNDLPDGVTSGACQYCGSLTTFPKFADEQTEHFYSRAESFRQRNDFDKAVAAFESILDVNSEDPEASTSRTPPRTNASRPATACSTSPSSPIPTIRTP